MIALQVLDRIFRKGYRSKKAGVLLSGLEPTGCRQLSRLAPVRPSDPKAERLMGVMGRANARRGRDTLRLAACGINQAWQMKQAALSPQYTACWADLPEVKA